MTTKTKKRKVSQKARVLAFLRTGKRLNPLTAWNRLGVYRLSAVIYTLRYEDEIAIETGMVSVKNRLGHEMNVASYGLKDAA